MEETKEVKAISRNMRISASKGRDLARVVKGKSVNEALRIVEFSPRKAAAMLGKTIKSAVANAEKNAGWDSEDLVVKTALFDKGPSMRRFRPRARGSASPIEKQTSHITVVLAKKS